MNALAGSRGRQTVGEIAATLPGATAVFRAFKLDFCCGGDVPLAEAAARRGADLAALERALGALDPALGGAAPEATPALIDHVLARFHETHRRELPELIRLARKVERVHGDHPKAPRGLADLLTEIQAELEDHMGKEEQVLFPLLRAGGHPMIAQPIGQMRHEHDHHGAQLRRLEAIADGFRLPEGACRSWQALYGGVAKFVDDVMEHIHLENNVLFPRFAAQPAA
jgi:regulator of cell morphogenesis and NO signaling